MLNRFRIFRISNRGYPDRSGQKRIFSFISCDGHSHVAKIECRGGSSDPIPLGFQVIGHCDTQSCAGIDNEFLPDFGVFSFPETP